MTPAVSVIIPLFDKEATVARAIDSVLAQGFANFELLVVDDGSTDSGPAVVESYADPRIRLIRQPNAGPGAARNRGAVEARGAMLAFLDADDGWRPDFLSTAVSVLEQEPSIGAFVAAHASPPISHPLRGIMSESGILALPDGAGPALVKAYVDAMATPCLAVRRAIFMRRGGFFAEARACFGEDSYLMVQLLLGERVWFEARPLVDIHVEDSALGHANRGRQPLHPALLRPGPLYGAVPDQAHGHLDALLALYRLRFTRRLASHGHWRAIRLLRRRYRWPRRVVSAYRLAEIRISLRCLLALLGLKGGGSAPDFAADWLERGPEQSAGEGDRRALDMPMDRA